MGYAPLDFLAKSEQPGKEFEVIKNQFIELGLRGITDMTESEFVDFAFSRDFCDEDYSGRFSSINYCLFMNMSALAQRLGVPIGHLLDGKYDVETEWKDLYLAPCLLDRWAKNKQVYKPDADFADALLGTQKLQIVKEQIEHLPFQNFYIDLSECPKFAPVVGIFMFIHERHGGVDIANYLLTENMVYFSFYGGGDYNENGIIEIDMAKMPTTGYEIYTPYEKEDGTTELVTTGLSYTLNRKAATAFALQLLCYITSEKPDISQDPVTKSTYRAPKTIRNRFSEVQRQEVGIRYGKSIRTKMQEIKKQQEEEQENAETDISDNKEISENTKPRKAPAPHFRCAHWQHYWTGTGRKNREVRWIEPIFVGFGSEKSAKDVVIHKIL